MPLPPWRTPQTQVFPPSHSKTNDQIEQQWWCSINVLPSTSNKWSQTSHPIKDAFLVYHSIRISYMHYFFLDVQVLLKHVAQRLCNDHIPSLRDYTWHQKRLLISCPCPCTMHSTSHWSRGVYSHSCPMSLGHNQPVRCNLGELHDDLAIRRCLSSLDNWCCVFTHLANVQSWTRSCSRPLLHSYVNPLASGRDRINILLNDICNTTDPTMTFEVIAAAWYSDLLLHGLYYANNSTGVDNGIFVTFGVQLHHPTW